MQEMLQATVPTTAHAPGCLPETVWCAVYCRPHFEFTVNVQLQAIGLETYLPVFQSAHQWSDRVKTIDTPVFPGYVLVHMANSRAAHATVLSKFGVVRILGNSRGIETIPDSQIEAVRRMLASGRECQGHPLLAEGARVRVRRGPLKGLEGLMIRVKNKYKLVVSLELLGRSISAEVAAGNVEILGAR